MNRRVGNRSLRRRLRPIAPLARVLALFALLAITLVLLALPTSAWAGVSYTAEELAVLSLINEYREANGLCEVLLSDTISDASTRHNLDMGKYGFTGHTTQSSDYFPAGASAWDRMRICGYGYDTYKGEILGYGFTSAQAVFEAWRDSPGHNSVMLGSEFRVAGVSMDKVPGSPYTYYWTVDFGGTIDPSAHEPGASSPTTTSLLPSTTTTTAPSSSTTTTTGSFPQFVDVPASYPFYREITTLAAVSVIDGYEDNSFRPNDPVTRAQFAKIIMLATGKHTELVEGIEHPLFRDVSYAGRSYPFDFVQEAGALGIIKGGADGTFGPYQDLTRAQLALMLVRAGGVTLTAPPAGFTLPFADVPEYAREAVTVAFYNRLLSGKTDTTFDPYGVATRGQVAKMVYQLMERLRT